MAEQPFDEQPRSARKKWLVALLLLIFSLKKINTNCERQ